MPEHNDHGDYYVRDVAATYTDKLEAENAALRGENGKLAAQVAVYQNLILLPVKNILTAIDNGLNIPCDHWTFFELRQAIDAIGDRHE